MHQTSLGASAWRSVVGCGAPVLPVVGLVFTGLSSGTLAVLSQSSRIAATTVLVLLSAAVLYLGWQTAPKSPASRTAE